MSTHDSQPAFSPARRRVLAGAAAAAAAPLILPSRSPGQPSAMERLNIAGIGVGGRGFGDMQELASENIVALCDVDHNYAAKAFKRFPKARRFKDYRQMLDALPEIDAVMVGTPDHTHAPITLEAMRRGKHVYCEKPLTHTVEEARRVAKATREAGVTTQMGIQKHATEGPRLICEWIGAGAIGDVHEVEAWCSLTYHPAGHAYWSPGQLTRPKDTLPLPEGLDWDRWIGPAPMRPYHRVYHPGSWRAWWDFGVGMMGDRGVHTFDSIVWALKLGPPDSIEATTMGGNNETHPLAAIITFRFPARGKLPPVKVTWYEGLTPPRPVELEDGRRFGGKEGGILFKGSQGMLMCDYVASNPRLIPEASMKAFAPNRPPRTLPRINGQHHQEFINACKSGASTGANFEYGALLTEICLLGNVAKRCPGKINWDAEAMRVTNHDPANAFVSKPYRKGWELT